MRNNSFHVGPFRSGFFLHRADLHFFGIFLRLLASCCNADFLVSNITDDGLKNKIFQSSHGLLFGMKSFFVSVGNLRGAICRSKRFSVDLPRFFYGLAQNSESLVKIRVRIPNARAIVTINSFANSFCQVEELVLVDKARTESGETWKQQNADHKQNGHPNESTDCHKQWIAQIFLRISCCCCIFWFHGLWKKNDCIKAFRYRRYTAAVLNHVNNIKNFKTITI